MTWTYSVALSTPKDQIRLMIGDTNSSAPILEDEEIDYLYDNNGSNNTDAAIACLEASIAKLSGQVNKRVGDLSISYSDRQKQLQNVLALLRRRRTLSGISPYAGGISISDMEANEADTDMVKTNIDRHTFELVDSIGEDV